MSAVAGGFGVLSGLFLGFLGGRWLPLPLVVITLSVILLLHAGGGPLRQPLLVAVATLLGTLSLPLLLNGSGVVLLIGCVFAVAAIFYRPPLPGAPVPGWLRERRRRSRPRPSAAKAATPTTIRPPSPPADPAGDGAGAADPAEASPPGA